MAEYDSRLIYTFAERLYSQARATVFIFSLLGAGLGYGLGMFVSGTRESPSILGLIFAIIAGVIGFLAGMQRAFALKLEAQIALCQVKIEENTRRR